jgi:hypothetical protein
MKNQDMLYTLSKTPNPKKDPLLPLKTNQKKISRSPSPTIKQYEAAN